MLRQHERRLPEVGAADRLLIAGEIAEVLALGDDGLLKNEKPISPSGVDVDLNNVKVRLDGQVRATLNGGPFALIVLGGASRPDRQHTPAGHRPVRIRPGDNAASRGVYRQRCKSGMTPPLCRGE